MAEAPDRYCGNCGHELSPTDQFCRNCGTPVHRAATVPTPEADVPVPPPPQAGGAGGGGAAAAPSPQQVQEPQEPWPRRHPIQFGCLALIVVFLIIGILAGGGGGGGGGGGKVAEKHKQDNNAALFANGQFYTFLHKENKEGDQLILGVLAGSESDSQIDKIAREIDYDKSRYGLVTVGVLTKDDVTQKQIEEMTKEDESVTGLSNEDFNQQGVLVISNSKAAESAFGVSPGEHTYFTSFKAMKKAASKSGDDKAEKKPEQKTPQPNAEYGVGQTAQVANVTWKVSDAYLTNQLKSNFGTQKQGRFVVVDFTFTNNRNEEVTLDPELHMILKDSSGREFGTDPDAYEFMPVDLDIFLEPVNPGVSTDGRVIYQVAPDAEGFTLRLDDVEFLEDKSAVYDLSNIPLQPYEEPASASATATASPAAQ